MRPLTQTDINLLTGIASQMAISIINAISYQILLESEKKYRDLVENAHSIILQMDKNGRITFFNEFAQRFFGYTEKEIIGKSVIGTIVPDTTENRAGLGKLIEDLALNPDRHTVSENKGILKNGDTVWIAWTYKPIFEEESVKEVLCIGSDVTKLRLAEQEKKNLEAQLQRAQKMEALGRLAGGVAHDLNNILTGIVSYPDLLLMQIPEDSTLRKPILAIQKSGEKAAAVVQDLLTMARRGVSVSEVVNLNDIVKEYLKSPEYKRLVQDYPDAVVETDLNPELVNILGSPVHLSKTLMNLVLNAAEAMGSLKGKITISTKSICLEKQKEGYESIKEGEYSVLSVSDTGQGISPEDLPKIFEPFYTKKVMGLSGSGLGLAVVWGTVKDHNGFIDIQTETGHGTRFDLYFPITRKQATKEEEQGVMEDFMGDEKILVVDDVEQQRDIASALLGRLGYTVIALNSGEKAVEFLKENTVDLVILDMIMEPGIDGLETYKRIVETHPDQKAIIVSGYAETERVKEAQALGVGTYLKKPYTLNKLGSAVRKALDG
ncbi:MAG TPA: PAS domain-containing sensor histidine kinase, partial [Deltaproteobacteria bacterium]|nr:PAS domain-containing sensor histidine kinase [Deltaproteobacteria bacterium]